MESTDNPFAAPVEAAGVFLAEESEHALETFVSARTRDLLHQVRFCVWVIGLFFSVVAINSFSWACQMMRTEDVWLWPVLLNMVTGCVVYLLAGVLLVRYGWRLGAYLKEGRGRALQWALEAQRLFFQALAVLALCWLLIQIVTSAALLSGVSPFV